MDNKLLAPIVRRLRLALGRGIVRLVSDAAGLQTIQLSLMENETRSDLERFQEYGFTSFPHTGAEAAVIFMGGNRDHGIIVAVDDKRYRLQGLEAGEVALYTDEGAKIVLKRGKIIEVECAQFVVNAETKVEFNTPTVRASGDMIDRYDTNDNTLAGMRQIYNNHKHNDDDGGGLGSVPNTLMD